MGSYWIHSLPLKSRKTPKGSETFNVKHENIRDLEENIRKSFI